MTDIFDQATEREEQERERAIAAARVPTVLPFLGVCHNCGEQVAPAARFCDADCMHDHERRRRAEALR